MSRLLIKSVKYIGSNYFYESPELKTGINILEGANGSGKTTFSSLIYFGLGGNVKWFKKDGVNDHKQITEDDSNYVELAFQIDDIDFIATRYFNSNEISVIGNSDVQVLPINRSQKKPFTFSDWILEKLDIEVVDIYQGSEYYKISFYDLIRLFYYDQSTEPEKIFKNPDNENFVTESLIIRKAIFEILMGNSFEKYYKALGDYRKILQEQSTLKSLISNFESLTFDSDGVFEDKNSYKLREELLDLRVQLERLETYRESISANTTSSKSDTEVISIKRKRFSELEEKIMILKKEKSDLVYDYIRVKRLHSNLVLEVTQLKKILITNEKLNLFSPDTCPYCLKKTKREPNKCICGNDVTDEQYQKFFYSKEDYLNILKSKQKNIETVDNAIQSYDSEVKKKNTQIALFENSIREIKSEINQLVKGKKVEKNLELKEVNDKIILIERQISEIKQQIKIEEKRELLEQQKSTIAIKVSNSKRDMDLLKLEASKSMDVITNAFNEKYYALMEKALDDCRSARISEENYLPIINSGAYKEASSNVSKRLMYFYTLLHLSLTIKTNFPKLLIIDTPENIGIDDDNLIKAISLLSEIGDEKTSLDDCQIILTTGENKYPDNLKNKVFAKITKKDRLLEKRNLEFGA